MNKYLIIIFFHFFHWVCFAQVGNHAQTISFNLGSGGFIPHKKAVQHLVGGPAYKYEIDFTLRTQGQQDFHQWYKYPYFGIVYAFETSGNPNLIGNMQSINLFVGLPFYNAKNPVRFRMGAGVGWVQKIFDLQNNHKSNAIGSHINSNIQFRLEKDLQIIPSQKLRVGLGFSHFSNASYQKPNLGINFAHLYLGYGLDIKKHAPIKTDKANKKITGENPIQYKIIMGFGIKENVTLLENKYFIGVLTGQLERKINQISSWLIASDNYINFALQNTKKDIYQSGISFGAMMHFDKIRLGFCMGTYLWNAPSKEEFIYNKVMVEYHFNEKLFCQLLLKSHKATADFINLTVGMKLR